MPIQSRSKRCGSNTPKGPLARGQKLTVEAEAVGHLLQVGLMQPHACYTCWADATSCVSIATPLVVPDPDLEPAVTLLDLLEDLVRVVVHGGPYLAEHNVIEFDLLWPPHGDVDAKIVGAHIGI